MAHSCPECGSICHCRGDIDDIIIPDDEAEARCECCLWKVEDDDDDSYDDYIVSEGDEDF